MCALYYSRFLLKDGADDFFGERVPHHMRLGQVHGFPVVQAVHAPVPLRTPLLWKGLKLFKNHSCKNHPQNVLLTCHPKMHSSNLAWMFSHNWVHASYFVLAGGKTGTWRRWSTWSCATSSGGAGNGAAAMAGEPRPSALARKTSWLRRNEMTTVTTSDRYNVYVKSTPKNRRPCYFP